MVWKGHHVGRRAFTTFKLPQHASASKSDVTLGYLGQRLDSLIWNRARPLDDAVGRREGEGQKAKLSPTRGPHGNSLVHAWYNTI